MSEPLPAPGTLWDFAGVGAATGTYVVATSYTDPKAFQGVTVLLVRFDPTLPVAACEVVRCGSWPWGFTASKQKIP